MKIKDKTEPVLTSSAMFLCIFSDKCLRSCLLPRVCSKILGTKAIIKISEVHQ